MSEHVEGSGAAVASHELLAEERQELERLRAELAALQAARPPTVRASLGAVGFGRLGGPARARVGAGPAVGARHLNNNQVSDTERFVATVSPVVEDPSCRPRSPIASLRKYLPASTSGRSSTRPSTPWLHKASRHGSSIDCGPDRPPRGRCSRVRRGQGPGGGGEPDVRPGRATIHRGRAPAVADGPLGAVLRGHDRGR